MGDEIGQPEYKRIMNDLRRQIHDGRLEVGSAIPSTVNLEKEYGVSSTVVRRAVRELRAEGLLYGQPGKAVYVLALPQDAQSEHQSVERLATGLAAVQSQVNEMQAGDPEQLMNLRAELAELRRVVAVLQTQLIDLYGRLGQPYQRDSAPLQAEIPATPTRRAAGA
ncbi:winged helix-turn-helix domain-containing protein [Streptomyces sp. NPDC006733]|uniref:winged helix-turn-helix domain-containing protein n=1 Tax=Streptomyces sp. NPDC006733 TaxID=3155460 RepID=UPI0033FDE574